MVPLTLVQAMSVDKPPDHGRGCLVLQEPVCPAMDIPTLEITVLNRPVPVSRSQPPAVSGFAVQRVGMEMISSNGPLSQTSESSVIGSSVS